VADRRGRPPWQTAVADRRGRPPWQTAVAGYMTVLLFFKCRGVPDYYRARSIWRIEYLAGSVQ
jgi:hypothetical protein